MEDLYISAIRYAITRNDKFPLGDIRTELCLSEAQFEMLTDEVSKGKILSHSNSDYVFSSTPHEVKVWASATDRFRLIEYNELQDARKSARSANTHAIIAIAISAILAMVSIGLTIQQMHDSDRDTDATLERLENISSTIEMVEARTILRQTVNAQNLAVLPPSPTPSVQ